MPVIKAAELAYGRLRSPDLDKQEEFLTAFGMVRADRTKNALYMRGTDEAHHLHVTELGEPKYVGIAFHAESLGDLEKLARVQGASKLGGKEPVNGWIALLLYLFIAPGLWAYLQVSLNHLWEAEADPLPGHEAPPVSDAMPPRLPDNQ